MSSMPSSSGDPDRTGPVSHGVISRAWTAGHADAGTGPVPIEDAFPDTTPQTVRRTAAPPPVPPRKPTRRGGRKEDVVALVLHQFPIGHMPVAASHPSRQHGDPRREAPVLDDADALARMRSGETLARFRSEPAERADPLPADVLAGHSPHGELGELEWDRAYRTSSGLQFSTDSTEPQPAAELVTLAVGMIVDRIGDTFGRIVFAPRTPFAERALPPEDVHREYRRFRVVRALQVRRDLVPPRLAQPGGGVRYQLPHSLVDLMGLGYLVELTKKREAAEACTLRLTPFGESDRTSTAGTRREQEDGT